MMVFYAVVVPGFRMFFRNKNMHKKQERDGYCTVVVVFCDGKIKIVLGLSLFVNEMENICLISS